MKEKQQLTELNEMILDKIEEMEKPGYETIPKMKKTDYIAIAAIVVGSLIVFYVTYLLY